MQRITPTNLSGDDLQRHYNIALNVRERMVEAAESGHDIHLDLSNARWFTPTFLVPLCVVYNRLNNGSTNVRVTPPSQYDVQTYLGQISFPGGTVEPASTYDNQIPLCLMNTDIDKGVIEVIGDEISKLLKKQFADVDPSGGIEWIKFPISEMIDNVDYHSSCDYGAVLVQNYPSKEFLDICIADDGISIPGNFDRFAVEYDDAVDALIKAAKEGKSTRPDAGHDRGYGLRATISLICDGLEGQIILSSKDATLSRESDSDLEELAQDRRWPGTMFAARLFPPDEDFHYLDYMTPE